jgi:tetratricopeptide (TPR) repeat protein
MQLAQRGRSSPRALCPALLLAAAWLNGCATQPNPGPPPAFVHHGPVVQVEPVDVLAVSPDMREFLQRYVTHYPDPETRITLLMTAVVDPAMLGFNYDSRNTLTAQQAFAQRQGNCVGFSNMMVALARAAGLQAHFQEITGEPEWFSQDDTVMVARHVNVVVSVGRRSWVMDSSGVQIKPGDRRRLISDEEALALYYNNLAVDAMLDGDHYRAWARLQQAVATAPARPDAWINMGVLYARNGQREVADGLYRQVLAQDPEQYSALSNLYALYEGAEEYEAVADIARQVERYRQRNPYYLLHRSEEALELGDLDTAQTLLDRAIGIKPGEYRFHLALAQVEYLAGDVVRAQASLERARELAPADAALEYAGPLAKPVP